jgi:hypothetical protein
MYNKLWIQLWLGKELEWVNGNSHMLLSVILYCFNFLQLHVLVYISCIIQINKSKNEQDKKYKIKIKKIKNIYYIIKINKSKNK